MKRIEELDVGKKNSSDTHFAIALKLKCLNFLYDPRANDNLLTLSHIFVLNSKSVTPSRDYVDGGGIKGGR